MNYQVIVGNIGTVYDGKNLREARQHFAEYLTQSKSGRGRAAGEPVDLIDDSGDSISSYPGTLENPIKGPGKFEGETFAARYAYDNPDEDLGESDGFGWYGKFSGKIKGRGPFHIIVNEDSQGFVSGTFFDTEKQLEKAWSNLESEYADFYEDEGEGDDE